MSFMALLLCKYFSLSTYAAHKGINHVRLSAVGNLRDREGMWRREGQIGCIQNSNWKNDTVRPVTFQVEWSQLLQRVVSSPAY